MYKEGKGVAKDYAKAVYWFTKAAKLGDVDAQHNLAACYYAGDGVEQDYSEALYWWKKAAAHDHPYAMYNLGVCYCNGQGVTKDLFRGKAFLHSAEALGVEEAKTALAKLI